MQNSLRQKTESFVKNTQSIKKDFRWQSEIIKRLAALLYVSEDKTIDSPAIKRNIELIKKHTSRLSPFRNNASLIIATMLSLNNDPDKLLKKTLEVYEIMRKQNFKSSDYLAVAAFQIASNSSKDQYDTIIKRAKLFYDNMKHNHRFLTGHNDYIYAALLGLSDIEINSGTERMEQLFKSLQPKFRSRYGVKALSQVLVFDKNQEDIGTRVTGLYNGFYDAGLKIDKSYALSSLGVLAILPEEIDVIMDEVIETSGLLRSKKGFGFWSSVSKQELTLLSSNLVAFDSIDLLDQNILSATLSTSIINIIIAQQTAASIAAMTAANSSASSSSH